MAGGDRPWPARQGRSVLVVLGAALLCGALVQGGGGSGSGSAVYALALLVFGTVSHDTYGLTPAQQRRARDLAVVADMPVTTAGHEVVAVVAGSSLDEASGLASDAGFDAHLPLALEGARVLVDLLGWFPDRQGA